MDSKVSSIGDAGKAERAGKGQCRAQVACEMPGFLKVLHLESQVPHLRIWLR